jgi:hypothetical protein
MTSYVAEARDLDDQAYAELSQLGAPCLLPLFFLFWSVTMLAVCCECHRKAVRDTSAKVPPLADCDAIRIDAPAKTAN